MAKVTVYRSEDDVRDWLRARLGKDVAWCEPSRGSTVGLPDCFVPLGGLFTGIEMKAQPVAEAVWHPELRPEQFQYAMRMWMGRRAVVHYLVGGLGTTDLWHVTSRVVIPALMKDVDGAKVPVRHVESMAELWAALAS